VSRRTDVFLSDAGEDRAFAEELAECLRGAGFNVWYDKFQPRVGDQLLARINEGLTNSRYGLLLISEAFLAKPWPGYEMDVLVRDQIEGRKVLLPIWHGVDAETVRVHQPGLAGVVALSTAQGIYELTVELAGVMVDAARTIAFVPDYTDPVSRFLRGTGELTLRRLVRQSAGRPPPSPTSGSPSTSLRSGNTSRRVDSVSKVGGNPGSGGVQLGTVNSTPYSSAVSSRLTSVCQCGSAPRRCRPRPSSASREKPWARTPKSAN
jgi:hypothetical protein